MLQDNFVIMKVNYSSENENEEFLKNYPDVPAYPHFFVLDSDGTLLHSQGTAELEEGRGYNQEAFLRFLNEWRPGEQKGEPKKQSSEPAATEKEDAEVVLSAALERAGAEQKLVFVHLSAPG